MENQNTTTTEVAHYSASQRALAELRERAQSLQIAGINDKEGYLVVKKTLSETVSLRNKIVNTRRDLKRQIDQQADVILEQIEPIEALLNALKAPIDAELQRQKEEKERRDYERFIQRTNTLIDLGFTQTGELYLLGQKVLAAATIKQLSEEHWAVELEASTILAENIRKEKEEQDRIKREQEEELERLRAELRKKQEQERPVQPEPVVTPEPVKPEPAVVLPEVVMPEIVAIHSTKTSEEDVKPPVVHDALRNNVMSDYTSGFESAKAQIIAYVSNNDVTLTRKSLIEYIINLKP